MLDQKEEVPILLVQQWIHTFVKNGWFNASLAVIRLFGLIVSNRLNKSKASLYNNPFIILTLMDQFLLYIDEDKMNNSFAYQNPNDLL